MSIIFWDSPTKPVFQIQNICLKKLKRDYNQDKIQQ